jgi:outer membrane protein W
MSRTMLSVVATFAVAAVLVTTPRVAAAQTTQTSAETQTAARPKARWEFLVPSGTAAPVATKGHAIKRGNLIAVQASYLVRPNLAVTSTLGWIRSRDLGAAGSPKLDVYTYDLGAEVRAASFALGSRASFKPFAGVGVGVRSYNYRSLPVDATHNPGAYVGVGGELGVRRVRLRLEVRDYVTGFTSLDGSGRSHTRNDVVVMAGVRFSR